MEVIHPFPLLTKDLCFCSKPCIQFYEPAQSTHEAYSHRP